MSCFVFGSDDLCVLCVFCNWCCVQNVFAVQFFVLSWVVIGLLTLFSDFFCLLHQKKRLTFNCGFLNFFFYYELCECFLSF